MGKLEFVNKMMKSEVRSFPVYVVTYTKMSHKK